MGTLAEGLPVVGAGFELPCACENSSINSAELRAGGVASDLGSRDLAVHIPDLGPGGVVAHPQRRQGRLARLLSCGDGLDGVEERVEGLHGHFKVLQPEPLYWAPLHLRHEAAHRGQQCGEVRVEVPEGVAELRVGVVAHACLADREPVGKHGNPRGVPGGLADGYHILRGGVLVLGHELGLHLREALDGLADDDVVGRE
mmetsp:Transcript_45379/g.144376  ORF Transcript_45379/g.144376 Transcript_45379/m.144376 type:complete len:200 (-) Transcript_45379:80-679(-)